MKRKLINGLLILMLLIGCSLLFYPTISDQWNNYCQSIVIDGYEDRVGEMEKEDFSKEWEAARAYNDSLEYNALCADVFEDGEMNLKDTEYWKVLNVADDGVMGYLSIPRINIKLAIYHGAEEKVLQKGIGHINGTKLPIGGESTHCVLSAHRGLPSARLFTDIDQLEKGDMFYVHVLDETFAYQVDQVLDMVDKNDAEALETALALEEKQDHVTLFTCTPYGVNSHRLLVRGSRVPYTGEEHVEIAAPEAVVQSVQNYYMIYLILGLAITVLLVVMMRFAMNRRNKREKN